MYYIVKTDILTGIGGTSSNVSLYKKAGKKELLLNVLNGIIKEALTNERVEYINGEEREYLTISAFDQKSLLGAGVTIQYKASSYGASFDIIEYAVVSDENTELICN